jgi:hypothetical protein
MFQDTYQSHWSVKDIKFNYKHKSLKKKFAYVYILYGQQCQIFDLISEDKKATETVVLFHIPYFYAIWSYSDEHIVSQRLNT